MTRSLTVAALFAVPVSLRNCRGRHQEDGNADWGFRGNYSCRHDLGRTRADSSTNASWTKASRNAVVPAIMP